MVRLVILIIIGVLVLSFFGITIQSIVDSPAGQANFTYVWSVVVLGWHSLVNFILAQVHSLQHVAS